MDYWDLLFPRRCLQCSSKGSYICDSCTQLVSFPRYICPVCCKFADYGITHDRCRSGNHLDGLWSLWKYEGIVSQAIISLKYKFASEIAEDLGKQSIKILRQNRQYLSSGSIIPIPLHPNRKRWRGFNQTEKIVEIIANDLDIPSNTKILERIVFNNTQVGLDNETRKLNIADAFKINSNNIPKKVILFDDVWTTGSTLREATKCLKMNGVEEVWGLTIAR